MHRCPAVNATAICDHSTATHLVVVLLLVGVVLLVVVLLVVVILLVVILLSYENNRHDVQISDMLGQPAVYDPT